MTEMSNIFREGLHKSQEELKKKVEQVQSRIKYLDKILIIMEDLSSELLKGNKEGTIEYNDIKKFGEIKSNLYSKHHELLMSLEKLTKRIYRIGRKKIRKET